MMQALQSKCNLLSFEVGVDTKPRRTHTQIYIQKKE